MLKYIDYFFKDRFFKYYFGVSLLLSFVSLSNLKLIYLEVPFYSIVVLFIT